MRHNFTHEAFMRKALVEARRALGRTSPNPAVGAVLVIDGKSWRRDTTNALARRTQKSNAFAGSTSQYQKPPSCT